MASAAAAPRFRIWALGPIRSASALARRLGFLSGLHRELSTKALLSAAVICALMPDEVHQFATTVLGRTSQLA